MKQAAAIALCAAFLGGCGTANNDAPNLSASGNHPAGWVASNGGNHHLAFQADQQQCAKCHGGDFKGGVTHISCSSTSRNGIICHANGHPPRVAPHALPFTNPALHGTLAKKDLTFCAQCHSSSPQGGAGSNPRFNAKIGALINGCEDCHNFLTAHPSSPLPDNAPWRGPLSHKDAQNLANACALCHGATLAGGTGPACASCHTAASPLTALNCTSCHTLPPNDTKPDGTPAPYPNIMGAHGTHDALNKVAGVCGTCHNGAGIGTLKHFNGTPDISILTTYNAKTGGAPQHVDDSAVPISDPGNTGGHCVNVSCHGGQDTPEWRTESFDIPNDCVRCHRARTVSDQFNSYFSGKPWVNPPGFATLHLGHVNAIGLACKDCHDATLMDPGTNPTGDHFKFLDTPAMEGAPAATIRSDVNYVGSVAAGASSCSPVNNNDGKFTFFFCHTDRRSWTP